MAPRIHLCTRIQRDAPVPETRVCPKCGKEKSTATDFYWLTSGSLHWPERRCKACKYLWFKAHRRQHKERYAQYRAESRERNPELEKMQRAKYRRTLKHQTTSRKYRLSSAGKKAIKKYEQSEAGRLSSLRKTENRRARKLGALTEKSPLITVAWFNRKVAEQKSICPYCLQEKSLTMDHRTPLSRGGKHEPDNIVAACLSCNSSKRDLTISEWRPEVALASYGLELASA